MSRTGAGVARGRGDAGFATVWALVIVALTMVVFGAVLALGHVTLVRQRVAGAADQAALAAATRWRGGEDAACGAARRVAGEWGARLTRCSVEGEVVRVWVEGRPGPFVPRTEARAGPPPEPVPPIPPAVPGPGEDLSGR
ncbi:Rv3654c family TadE-like protein [Streptomyces sp. BI20]|uniref:Rv3654c family TadE-like protein n=1 Tax=Streptomyces sp. BI20 TaxID=3403460 RepID=UPI003C711163